MAKRLYRRTDEGRKVWDTQNPSVPLEYRRILGLIGMDTDPQMIRARLGRYSEAELNEILDELEQSGYVKSTDAGGFDRTDLDFTGKLSLAALQAAQEAARLDLDFTGTFSAGDFRPAIKKA